MCGRFTLRTPNEQLVKHFFAASIPVNWPEYKFRYNVAPSQLIAAVRWTTDSPQPELTKFAWGLVPAWSKEKKSPYNMINARAESITEKPSFRTPFRKSRCLIVADGFYEWQKIGDRKIPKYITRRDGGPFCFAGLWDRWSKGGETVESATIITTTANELMSQFHDRMPVIIAPQNYPVWLRGFQSEEENHVAQKTNGEPNEARLLELLVPDDTRHWQAVTVSTRVNSVRNDDEQCLIPGEE